MKAWDLKDLVGRFQVAGLPMLESSAVKVINLIIDWAEDSIRASDSKLDDFMLMGLPLVRKYALEMADKISDEDNKDVNVAIKDARQAIKAAADHDGRKKEEPLGSQLPKLPGA